MNEIRALTSLRFVAAIYVFIFHVHLRWPLTANEYAVGFVSQGAVGMTLFFMLSGYILAYRYESSSVVWSEYFWSRFSRIYPVYFAAALITIPWVNLPPANQNVIADVQLQVGRWIMLLLADVTILQAWFPALFKYWNNGGSWSISNEMFFYAVFPFVMPLIASVSVRNKIRWLLGCYFFSLCIGWGYILFDSGGAFAYYYALPIFRIPEFLIGIALFHFARSVSLSTAALECGLFVVAAVWSIYLCLFGGLFPIYITHNWINIPMIAVLLLVLSRPDSIVSKMFSMSPLVWAGRISYCFYSFQAVIIFCAIDNHKEIILRIPALSQPKLWAFSLFAALMIISALAYYLLEEPCRVCINTYLATRRKRRSVTRF